VEGRKGVVGGGEGGRERGGHLYHTAIEPLFVCFLACNAALTVVVVVVVAVVIVAVVVATAFGGGGGQHFWWWQL
jgi:hypothetical protein